MTEEKNNSQIDGFDWSYIDRLPKKSLKTKHALMRAASGLCSCGSGKDFDLLIETLRFAAMDSDAKHAKTGGAWDKGCYQSAGHELAMKVLDSLDLVEHGTGIGWAWATEDGKKLLAMLDALPDEEEVVE